MSNCVKITIAEGTYSGETLDTQEPLRLTRKLEELNDVNNINTDGVLGFDLPATDNNYDKLKGRINPNVIDQDYSSIKVDVSTGSMTLRNTQLYILQYRANDNAFSVEIRRAEDHWLTKAENLPLCNIDFGELLFDWGPIATTWQDHSKYLDGDQGVIFPIAHYGRFIDSDRLNVEDLRPWFHVLAVLQKGFCQIGWDFESEVLETNLGRRMYAYILKKNYDLRSNTPEDGLLATVDRTFTPPQEIQYNETIEWDNTVYDFFNQWSGGETFTGNGRYEFEVKGQVNLTNNTSNNLPASTNMWLGFTILDSNGDVVSSELLINRGFSATYDFPKSFKSTTIQTLLPGQTIEFFITLNSADGTSTLFDFFTEFNHKSRVQSKLITRFVKGANLVLKDHIKCEASLLDFFKGVVHMFSGKLETDWVNKKVIMRPPYKGEWDGEAYDGYFIQNEDVSDVVSRFNSEIISTPQDKFQRHYKLLFQESDDFVEREYSSEYELYSKEVDYDQGNTNETKEDENPFFAPTLNAEYSGLIGELTGQPSDVNIYPSYIPFLWDNDNLEDSRDITPRVLLGAYGKAFKELDGDLTINPDIYVEGIGWFQDYLVTWQKMKGWFVIGNDNTVYDEQGLFYGDADYPDQSLFTLFWQEWLINSFNNASVEVLSVLSNLDYKSLDFRKRYAVSAMGRMIVGYLKEIRDYDACNDITTPLVVQPTRQLTAACLDDTGVPPSDECDNTVELTVTWNDPCYDFTADTSGVNSPIDQTIIEYRYHDETTWTTANQLCSPDRPFFVRVQVLFSDDCPGIFDIKYINACANEPEIIFDYDEATDCLTISIGGTNSSDIDQVNTTLEYQIDGGTWTTYTTDICNETGEICARATVVYEDGCPDEDIEDCITIPIEYEDCDETTAAIECVDVAGGYVNFNKIGVIANEDQVMWDYILYREVGDTDWILWNGEDVPCPVEAKRIIEWCDDICPTYCSPVIICQCDCQEFNAGTPNQLAVCQ